MNQHRHKKRFGQHFLRDAHVLDAMTDAIAPQPTDHLIEIGPGLGVLSERLIDRVASLTAVEIDNDLIEPLIHRFGNRPHFRLIHQDALTLDYTAHANGQPLRVVGNLPYNISTPLIFHLLKHRQTIKDMHFMLQKEVVQRLVSAPNGEHYGRLSVMTQYFCATEELFHIGPQAFDPPPKVESAVVRLLPYPQLPYPAKSEANFSHLVRQAFSMRRKTLRNTLKNLLTPNDIEACHINPQARAETLSVADFVTLSNCYTNKVHAL